MPEMPDIAYRKTDCGFRLVDLQVIENNWYFYRPFVDPGSPNL
jgi:hypothetical protein